MSEIVLGIYAIVACISAFIVVKVNRKNNLAGDYIGQVMISVFFLILFYAFTLMADHIWLMEFGLSISLFMLDFVMYFFLKHVIEFTNFKDHVPNFMYTLLIIWMVIDGIMLISSPINKFAIDYTMLDLDGRSLVAHLPKAPFTFHILLIVIMAVYSVIILCIKFSRTPRMYWKRYYCILISVIIGIITNYVYLMQKFYKGIDISVLAYGVIGGLLYFNTFKYQNVVNKSITRTMLLDYLREPIILFDYEGYLSDYTGSMLHLFPQLKNYCSIGSNQLTNVKFMELAGIDEVADLGKGCTFECKIEAGGRTQLYECVYNCMKSNNNIIGSSFEFHDITSLKSAYFALENSIVYDNQTGLFNKEAFFNQIPQWESKRYWPITIAVFNINSLTKINDTLGMEYGNQVVVALSNILRTHILKNHFIAKIDDDMIVVFENTSQKQVIEICERVRNDFELLRPDDPLTLEYGVAEKNEEDENDADIEKLFQIARKSMEKKKMLHHTSASSSLVDSLRQTLSESDYETEEHVERTRVMASRLGKEMELSDAQIAHLELLAVLHDIGKVAVPHSVLLKKGKLTAEERKIIQEHTVKGYRIAKISPDLSEIADCILSHHEKWDGTGYPNQLKGEEIPLLARIISAVDSHDVMVHNRPYHTAMPQQDAIDELRRCSGTQFDPKVVEIFTALLEREELPKETI